MKPWPAVRLSWKRFSREMESDAPATPASTAPMQTLEVADTVHADADRVGGGRVLADRLDLEAEGGLLEDPPDDGNEQEGPVGQDVVAEEDRADEGDFESSGIETGLKPSTVFTVPIEDLEEEARHPQAEHVEADAAHALLGLQGDADEGHRAAP